VREPASRAIASSRAPLARLGAERRAAPLLFPLAIFTLGNSSDSFILLNVGRLGSGPVELSLLWVGLHAVKSVVSLRSGPIADRIGPTRLVIGGWIVYAAVYVGFAFATSTAAVVVLCLAYGMYHGSDEGAEKRSWRRSLRRRAAARTSAGTTSWSVCWHSRRARSSARVWTAKGSAAAFLLGAGLAGLASLALLALRPGQPVRVAGR
jgi:sugar phosphate permease